MDILQALLLAMAGAASWGLIHTGLFRKKNGTTNGLNKFAADLIEQNNIQLKHDNLMLEKENRELLKRVLELEKRVHELEVELKQLKKNTE